MTATVRGAPASFLVQRVEISEDDYVEGAPELIAEIALKLQQAANMPR